MAERQPSKLLVVLTNFWVLGTTRLSATIRATALQGALLALLPVALYPGLSLHILGLASYRAAPAPADVSGAVASPDVPARRPLRGEFRYATAEGRGAWTPSVTVTYPPYG